MSELPLSLGVIFFFLAVVVGVVWIIKGFLAQRDELSAVKAESSDANENHPQTA